VELAEGHELIVGALRRGRPDRYTLQAAIASLYAEPPTFAETDWPQALYLYDQLLQIWPTPVVALNRTVPLSYVAGPAVALAQIEDLERDGRLAGYPYLAAVKADLLTRLGRTVDAAEQYRRALELTDNPAEREFLLGRLESLDDSTSSTDSQVRLS
jgi:RNA polymerase sigma-70 factor (ECF subfamily)